MIIAIDGPSGAGKSTVAAMAAKKLGFSTLDTGAMYRSIAWAAEEEGVPLDDEEALAQLARTRCISFEKENGTQRVLLDGRDITSAIRTARIDKAVSPVSAVPAVREALVGQQRRIGSEGNYVVEGRDIGTTVFPDAAVKVFLTASAAERARRRVEQNQERGVGSTDYDEVLAAIERRDGIDSSRAASPLKPADDAVTIDSTGRSIDDVVNAIVAMARQAKAR